MTPALEETLRAGLEPASRAAHRLGRGVRARARLAARTRPPGASLALSVESEPDGRSLMESFVRTAAGVFEAAAASVALIDEATGELVYRAAWGAGAEEVVGVRLPAGAGIAGAAVAEREGIAVPNCRSDPRFAVRIAEGTGYVPHTMLVVPLVRDGEAIGALSVLDRRDGGPTARPTSSGRSSSRTSPSRR